MVVCLGGNDTLLMEGQAHSHSRIVMVKVKAKGALMTINYRFG